MSTMALKNLEGNREVVPYVIEAMSIPQQYEYGDDALLGK